MMCHRVSRFRVKHEKTTGFQGKMDFRNTPIGDASFFVKINGTNPVKSKQWLEKFIFPPLLFLFTLVIFYRCKKWDCSLSGGLPILQKISLRRRESRLAARALPSAVKSIFRRPRSAAFRRHPPYSCLEYGSVDYIIFAPVLRRAFARLVDPRPGYHFFVLSARSPPGGVWK